MLEYLPTIRILFIVRHMKLKMYQHNILILLLVIQIVNCYCNPNFRENGSTNQLSLNKRSPMQVSTSNFSWNSCFSAEFHSFPLLYSILLMDKPVQNEDSNPSRIGHPNPQHSQQRATSNGLRPGRQEYRVFSSEPAQSHSTTPTQPRRQRQRPSPIHTERQNRFGFGGRHFGGGGGGRSHSPSREHSPPALAQAIGGGLEGATLTSMGMEPHLGVMPNAGRHRRRTEVGLAYTAPNLSRSSSSSSSGAVAGCVGCLCDALLGGLSP